MTPTRFTSPGRVVAAVLAAVAATAAFTGGASADPAAAQAFKAEHTDRCLSSYTTGDLTWQPSTTPVGTAAVKVVGLLALRGSSVCTFPTRPVAVAVFTAYSGRTVVDAERQSTANSTGFEFVLDHGISPTPAPTPIDRVTVQVCHTAGPPSTTPTTCGPISTYPF